MSYEGYLFFCKCSKCDVAFINGRKNSENIFCFLDNWIWIGCSKFSLLPRQYLLPIISVLTKCLRISHIMKRDIFQESFTHSDEEIWQKCCHAEFTSVWDSSTCWLFRHLSNHVFRNLYFPTYISYEGHLFFSKCLKIDIDFGNGGKISQKIIHLSDNCIWIGCGKVSLLGREYLSWAVNVLTKLSRISHITKRDIFQVSLDNSDEEIW